MGRKKILKHKVIQAFVLELEQLEWLRKTAGNLNQSVSAFVRDMIEEFRDKDRISGYALGLTIGKHIESPKKSSLWQRMFGR